MPGLMATKPPWVREELRSRSLAILDKQGRICVSKSEFHEHDEQAEAVERSASFTANVHKLHDDVTLVALLKACTKQKDLCQGNRLHAVIVRHGLLDKNIIVGNSLVNFYAKCGALETAQKVLHELPNRDVVSWTTVIARFCEHGHGEKALNCFDWMKLEGLSPDPTTLASILRACGNTRDLERGKGIHVEIVREGWLKEDIVLGSALLDMYAKCGALGKAQQVFNDLSARDLVSWNSLIAGYAQHGYGEEALNCFRQSILEGLPPDLVTFTCILKACGTIGALDEGRRLHAEIAGKGLWGEDVVLGSAMVDMYAKCGALTDAQQVFDELPRRNEVCWTSLITGFCQHLHCEEALACFDRMKHDGLSPDRVTFACILKACGSTGAAGKGREIHAEILRLGLLNKDSVLGNALLDMYCKFGALMNAQEVFDNLPVRNLVSWNALISGYSQYGHGQEALTCFEQLQCAGLLPDAVTYTCVLKACGSIGAVEEGIEVHAEVIRKGLLETGVVLGNSLVDMYAKCGSLALAHQVFNELPVRDVVSWNALITGYCEHGFGEQGLDLLEHMRGEGLHPDAVTFACILKACGIIKAAEQGEGVHNEIVKTGLLEGMNVHVLGNALVNMYGNCGVHEKAQQLFEQLSARDVVSWNVLMSGCCKYGHGKEALKFYEMMKCDNISPDAVTFACVLKACSIMGAAEKGQEIFAEIMVKGLLENCVMLGNALVSMYVQSSLLVKAKHVFDELQVRDVVSWNALITGYCQHGLVEEVLICFEQLKHEGLSPDAVTFAHILKVCGSIGVADILPTLKHYTCVMELFGHADRLDKSVEVIKRLPSFCYLPRGFPLIRFSQESGIVDFGRLVSEHVGSSGELAAAA